MVFKSKPFLILTCRLHLGFLWYSSRQARIFSEMKGTYPIFLCAFSYAIKSARERSLRDEKASAERNVAMASAGLLDIRSRTEMIY